MSTPVPATTPAPAYPKEMTLKELDPRLQKQIEQADKAIDKNPSFAVDICTNILNGHPGAVDARRILRKAQRKGNPAQKGMTKMFGNLTNSPFAFKSGSRIKTDPKGVFDESEKLIAATPSNITALRMQAQAAEAMKMWLTAVLNYEAIYELQPENIENLMAAGNALIEGGMAKDATKWGDRILEIQPGNGDAQAMLRRASVAVTMDKGKWDEQTDFRQKLHDANKAQELEQQSRIGNDAASLEILVKKLAANIEQQPDNINYYRDMVGYLKQLERYDDAIKYVQMARQQPLGKADTSLEKIESDLTVAALRIKREKLEAAIAVDPSRQPELAILVKQEMEFKLQEAKGRVEKYPNDYGYRFDYGTLLYETGSIDQAIRELQQARRNPKVSHRAMLYLGRAYRAKGIYDLAIQALEQAKGEMAVMNDLKKEIIYELAQCYRAAGNVEKAVNEYRIIYSDDIDYRDVAKIINEYYEKKTLS